jgi:hypothetical protein
MHRSRAPGPVTSLEILCSKTSPTKEQSSEEKSAKDKKKPITKKPYISEFHKAEKSMLSRDDVPDAWEGYTNKHMGKSGMNIVKGKGVKMSVKERRGALALEDSCL